MKISSPEKGAQIHPATVEVANFFASADKAMLYERPFYSPRTDLIVPGILRGKVQISRRRNGRFGTIINVYPQPFMNGTAPERLILQKISTKAGDVFNAEVPIPEDLSDSSGYIVYENKPGPNVSQDLLVYAAAIATAWKSLRDA